MAESYDTPQTWYFTFGVGGENRNRYVVIDGVGSAEARRRMVEVFGTSWAFQYSEDTWIVNGVSQAEKYGLERWEPSSGLLLA